MAVKKISVSLDTEVFERAKRAAAAEGISLSTWLSRAAAEAAELAAAQEALMEYTDMYGEPDAETMSQARAELDQIGFWTPETADEAATRHSALARLRGELPDQRRRHAG
jgi:hypothetical protein